MFALLTGTFSICIFLYIYYTYHNSDGSLAKLFYCFALTKGLKEMGEKFEKIFRKNLKFPANFSWAETGNIYFYFCFGNKNKSSCSEARLPRESSQPYINQHFLNRKVLRNLKFMSWVELKI